MIVYKSFMVKTITYSAVLITWSTIILCYVLAVSLGHVQAWLPTISDCAVKSPEKYPFRFGLNTGAVALFVNVIMVYYAFPDFNLRKLKLVTGVSSCIGLATVASVNEHENNTLHTAGATTFFSGYVIFMLLVAYSAHKDTKISSASATNKRVFAILGVIVLAAAGLLSLNWSEYHDYVAVCEWLGVFDIEMFNLTFVQDFETLTLLEAKPDNWNFQPTISGYKDTTEPTTMEKLPI